MKVIITQNSKGIGTRGQVKTVKSGFFRNFLQPKGMAVAATKSAMASWETRHAKEIKAQEEVRAEAGKYAEELKDVVIELTKKLTAKNTYYSAISAEEICEALKDQKKIALSASNVEIEDHIKEPGTYPVNLRLADDVSVTITLEAK